MATAYPVYSPASAPGLAQYLDADTMKIGSIEAAGTLKLAPLTLGSVPFIGASGLVSQDNANFFWDDTNNRLGLGTAAPSVKLHLLDNTTSPTIKLESTLNGAADNTASLMFQQSSTNYWLMTKRAAGFTNNVNQLQFLYYNGTWFQPLIITPTSRVGISDLSGGAGCLDPVGALEVRSATFPPIQGTRTSTETNTLRSGVSVEHRTTADMVDGFGCGLSFMIRDSAGVSNGIASINALRAGADNTGDLTFSTYAAGVTTEKVRIKSDGKVGIGLDGPTSLLHVKGSGSAFLPFKLESTSDLQIGMSLKKSTKEYILGVDLGNNGGGDFFIWDATSAIYRLSIATDGIFTFQKSGTTGNVLGNFFKPNAVSTNTSELVMGKADANWQSVRFGYYYETTQANCAFFVNHTGESWGSGAGVAIFPTGKVGIGVYPGTSCDGDLHIYRAGGPSIKAESDSTHYASFTLSCGTEPAWGQGANIQLGGGSSPSPHYMEIVNRCNGPMLFYTNNVERMRILSDGKVGIGTQTPGYTLSVNKAVAGNWMAEIVNATSGGASLYLAHAGGEGLAVNAGSNLTGTSYAFQVNKASTSYLYVMNGGFVGIGTASPQVRLDVGDGTPGGGGIKTTGTFPAITAANALIIDYDAAGTTGRVVALGATGSADGNLSLITTRSDRTNWNTRLYIQGSDGKVGIGTVSPAHLLDVRGDFSIKTHAAFAGSESVTETGAIQTTNDTATPIWTKTLSDNTLYWVEVHLIGRDTAGTHRAYYQRTCYAYRQGGGAAIGNVIALVNEETADWNVTIAPGAVNTNDIEIHVVGAAATTINWTATVKFQAVSGNT